MEVNLESVKKVIGDVLKIDTANITEATNFIDDLKADSMDQFFLVEGFSEAFDITIDDDNAKNIKTVGDVLKLIQK